MIGASRSLSTSGKGSEMNDRTADFDSREFRAITRKLSSRSRQSAIPITAALLTVPEFAHGTLRLELLVHLAVLHCQGKLEVTLETLVQWVDIMLYGTSIRMKEDPPEDVFVGSVMAPGGNYL